MKKLFLSAAALVALAAAAPAQAAIVSKHVDQDPDAVRAYWTDARMRSAIPLDRARAGEPQSQGAKAAKPGGTSSTTTWSTLQVNWLTAPTVLKAHGKVFFSDGAWNYVCSGTAMTSSSGSVAWTAGHCVNEGPGAFYTNWAFVPAYNSGGTQPYGKWPATKLFTTTQWQTQANAFGHDLGAAHLATQNGLTLAQTLPAGASRALDTHALQANERVSSYGYPAEGKYSGQNMYVCDSYIARRDTSVDPPTYGIPCGMNGGSSGGGWIDPDSQGLVSVNSYGYQSLKNTMFGPVVNSDAVALLNSADAG